MVPTATDGDCADPELLFILGISHRSGTNYLAHLCALHPDCVLLPDLGEDYLVYPTRWLTRYANEVAEMWNPSWDPEGRLARRLTKVVLEVPLRFARELARERSPTTAPARVLVAHTPDPSGIEQLALMEGARGIALVRDGRAIVESGIRAFGWKLEEGAERWTEGARKILAATQRDSRTLALIRYEDVYRDLRGTMSRILHEATLDPDVYDFERARDLPVFGSCELGRTRGLVGFRKIHWEPVPKPASFNPLERWSHWTRAQHRRFNAIAGQEMIALGYATQ